MRRCLCVRLLGDCLKVCMQFASLAVAGTEWSKTIIEASREKVHREIKLLKKRTIVCTLHGYYIYDFAVLQYMFTYTTINILLYEFTTLYFFLVSIVLILN